MNKIMIDFQLTTPGVILDLSKMMTKSVAS